MCFYCGIGMGWKLAGCVMFKLHLWWLSWLLIKLYCFAARTWRWIVHIQTPFYCGKYCLMFYCENCENCENICHAADEYFLTQCKGNISYRVSVLIPRVVNSILDRYIFSELLNLSRRPSFVLLLPTMYDSGLSQTMYYNWFFLSTFLRKFKIIILIFNLTE